MATRKKKPVPLSGGNMSSSKLSCSPDSMKNIQVTGTCYSPEELVHIAQKFGIRDARRIQPRKLGQLVMSKIKHSPPKKNNTNKRPEKPDTWKDDPYTWLNTMDALAVMRQYEKAYKTFKFVGVYPRDFAVLKDSKGVCVVGNMCNFNPVKLINTGATRLGFILNLDTYGNPGTHWVALMLDIPRGGVYYFDSTADPPPYEILKFMQQLRHTIHKEKKMFLDIEHNNVVRQYKDTECGVFSLAFLVLMLETKMSFSEVCKFIPLDADVHMLREVFFV